MLQMVPKRTEFVFVFDVWWVDHEMWVMILAWPTRRLG